MLIKELDSRRYQRWVDEYIAFVQAEGIGVADRRAGRAAPRAGHDAVAHLGRVRGRAAAYEPVMRWADVTTLHDLRIAAKWLRYTLEFVREALGSESAPVIERVVALQDHLGWLHDADVAAGLARGVPRRACRRPDRGGERRDRALPRRPRAGARAAAADRRPGVARGLEPRLPARVGRLVAGL